MSLASRKDSPPSAEGTGYSVAALAEIVGISTDRVREWVAQGLLIPASGDGEAARFDFAELSMAQTLRDLSARGDSLQKLRRAMRNLKKARSSAGASAPILHDDGNVVVRLQAGELAQPDGQLCLEFDNNAEVGPSLGMPASTTPQQWYETGVVREADGDLPAAIDCYRRALLEGGPDKDVCFALAHALSAVGHTSLAAERYRQVVEIDPQHADAWLNLGAALAEIDCRAEACDALRRALDLRPGDARAHYNLADTLDELGQYEEAAEHWRAYLEHDRASQWAAHARKRLAAV